MSDGEDTAKLIPILTFPVMNEHTRHLLARDDKCPECGGELDTGWECAVCQYDAMNDAYPKHVRGSQT